LSLLLSLSNATPPIEIYTLSLHDALPISHDTVRELREEILPGRFAGTRAETYVTGQTAYSRDSIALIEEYTPYVFALVLGASFVLLLVAFRSLGIPLKSILMNLLSVGGAYG